VFDETPLGKRREAQAEKMGWYEGNPSFGRVSSKLGKLLLRSFVSVLERLARPKVVF
jgi:hypothetical protein